MIKIVVIDGPQEGTVFIGSEFKNSELIFQYFLEIGAEWFTDFSFASNQEGIDWGLIDMRYRCLRAIKDGRSIIANNKSYICISKKENDMLEIVDAVVEDLKKFYARGWTKIIDDRKRALIITSTYIPGEWN